MPYEALLSLNTVDFLLHLTAMIIFITINMVNPYCGLVEKKIVIIRSSKRKHITYFEVVEGNYKVKLPNHKSRYLIFG